MEYGGHGAGFYLLKAYFMNINFCRISFQPGATYLHETSSSNILQDGKLGASFLKSLCLFGRALGGGNKTLGCYHGNVDRVFWFCLSVASSLCLHLDPVSWLAEVFTFLDKKVSACSSHGCRGESFGSGPGISTWITLVPYADRNISMSRMSNRVINHFKQ